MVTPRRAGPAPAHLNEVHLVGRLAATPVHRELPSGDLLVQFRLVVDRAPLGRPRPGQAGRGPTIDTLDCAAWRKDVQRTMAGARPGDLIDVSGSLRRRFWRAATGPASRTEVEVVKARRLARAAA
ncbi:MAG: single-stranded DNA-binding protein [Actinomycetes bacterium]